MAEGISVPAGVGGRAALPVVGQAEAADLVGLLAIRVRKVAARLAVGLKADLQVVGLHAAVRAAVAALAAKVVPEADEVAAE